MTLPTAAEVSKLRSKLYGMRVADDPNYPAEFVAICPQHRILGRHLSLKDARALLDRHEIESHS